jgi:hypothetical protein
MPIASFSFCYLFSSATIPLSLAFSPTADLFMLCCLRILPRFQFLILILYLTMSSPTPSSTLFSHFFCFRWCINTYMFLVGGLFFFSTFDSLCYLVQFYLSIDHLICGRFAGLFFYPKYSSCMMCKDIPRCMLGFMLGLPGQIYLFSPSSKTGYIFSGVSFFTVVFTG